MKVPASDTHIVILSSFELHGEAWRSLLSNQPGIFVAGVITELSQAPISVSSEQAFTILIDLPSPDPQVVRQLKQIAPQAGLLCLVRSYDLPGILPLLQAGATGFIARSETVGDLARAVIAAGRGEVVLPPAVAVQSLIALAQHRQGSRNLPESNLTGPPTGEGDVAEPLTEREMGVLNLLAQGLTNKDIAQTLILSVRTVEAHLRHIFAKLGVRSRTEAVLWAVRNGYGVRGGQ
jgi:DNA-binding NarL/FixJ family response regulator